MARFRMRGADPGFRPDEVESTADVTGIPMD